MLDTVTASLSVYKPYCRLLSYATHLHLGLVSSHLIFLFQSLRSFLFFPPLFLCSLTWLYKANTHSYSFSSALQALLQQSASSRRVASCYSLSRRDGRIGYVVALLFIVGSFEIVAAIPKETRAESKASSYIECAIGIARS